MSTGQIARIGMCFQNSWGTYLTSSMHWLPIISEDVTLKRGQVIDDSMIGVFDENGVYAGPQDAGGSVSMRILPNPVGALLKSVIGEPTTVTSSSVRTHTFIPRTNDWDMYAPNQPVTFYKYLAVDCAMLSYDLVGNELEISAAQGELMTIKAGFVGGNFRSTGSIAPSYDGGKKISWDASSITIDGTAIKGFESISIKVNNGLAPKYTLGSSNIPARVARDNLRTIEISGTLKFNADSKYQKFFDDNDLNLNLFFRSATLIQSGYYEGMNISIPAVRFTEFPIAAGGPGEIMASFGAKGFYHATSGSAMTITLTNQKAGY